MQGRYTMHGGGLGIQGLPGGVPPRHLPVWRPLRVYSAGEARCGMIWSYPMTHAYAWNVNRMFECYTCVQRTVVSGVTLGTYRGKLELYGTSQNYTD